MGLGAGVLSEGWVVWWCSTRPNTRKGFVLSRQSSSSWSHPRRRYDWHHVWRVSRKKKKKKKKEESRVSGLCRLARGERERGPRAVCICCRVSQKASSFSSPNVRVPSPSADGMCRRKRHKMKKRGSSSTNRFWRHVHQVVTLGI